jgi:signal transduction histidine kinase
LPEGTVLLRARPGEPFGALALTFRAGRLPDPPGAALVYWLGAALALVLGLGTWLLYRVGLRQLALVRQQQDFVAAVSHELKTPLTSIRMYSEMLSQGWVDDSKRAGYYRFIHDESERLSRLVENVLALARMGRGALRVQTRPVAAAELLAQAGERLASQARQAGFTLAVACDSERILDVDPDAMMQILINLVDNALKFAASGEPRRIDIGCAALADGRVELSVRDYGPGIPRADRRRVFRLFQRLDNEVTRGTRGTGIGLALVERLTRAMGGEVDLVGCEPGVEVRLRLPARRRGRDAAAAGRGSA